MNLEANREVLLEAIKAERAYQDAKWGPLSGRSFKSLAGWYLIAREELLEAQDAWNSERGNDAARAELLQFVASGFACLEQLEKEPFDEETLRWCLSEHPRPFEEWLVAIEFRLDMCKIDIYNRDDSQGAYRFGSTIAMGMAALLQHGVVTRGGTVFEECMSCEGIFDATGYDIEDTCPLCKNQWTKEQS